MAPSPISTKPSQFALSPKTPPGPGVRGSRVAPAERDRLLSLSGPPDSLECQTQNSAQSECRTKPHDQHARLPTPSRTRIGTSDEVCLPLNAPKDNAERTPADVIGAAVNVMRISVARSLLARKRKIGRQLPVPRLSLASLAQLWCVIAQAAYISANFYSQMVLAYAERDYSALDWPIERYGASRAGPVGDQVPPETCGSFGRNNRWPVVLRPGDDQFAIMSDA
jgi:hypothetical protein